jgi:hypothetical protein
LRMPRAAARQQMNRIAASVISARREEGSIAAALGDPTSNEATSQKRRNPSGRDRFALGLRCSVGRVSPWIHSLPRASPRGKTALGKLDSILRSAQ